MVVVCMFDGVGLFLGERVKTKNDRHGNRGSGSPWRPCHEPCLRLGVSCGTGICLGEGGLSGGL